MFSWGHGGTRWCNIAPVGPKKQGPHARLVHPEAQVASIQNSNIVSGNWLATRCGNTSPTVNMWVKELGVKASNERVELQEPKQWKCLDTTESDGVDGITVPRIRSCAKIFRLSNLATCWVEGC